MNCFAFLTMAAAAIGGSGCLLEAGSRGSDRDVEPSEEDVAEAASAFEEFNALTLNALTLNALTLNALNLAALSPGALSPGALTSIQSSGSNGYLARSFVKYAVGCAFTASQSFSFSWVDGLLGVHQETYWGSIGIAPGWATGELTAAEESWVSACLISRVNWYGLPVMISLRGSNSAINHVDDAEISAYSVLEGAFWGDLFGSSPTAFACHYTPNIDESRLRLRDCAAGHLSYGNAVDCGIIDIVGSCEELCNTLQEGDKFHYPSCSAEGSSTTAVITTWLHQ